MTVNFNENCLKIFLTTDFQLHVTWKSSNSVFNQFTLNAKIIQILFMN